MDKKYKRNYRLEVQRKDGTTLVILPPFTIEFDIHRNSFSSANVGQLRIYNLSPSNRSQLRKNQFDFGDQRIVKFFAGYGDNLALAFTGNITQAWSVREGTNMVTQIESFDGGYAYVNAITDEAFVSGTPTTSIIDSFIQSLPGTELGVIGSYPGQISRGNSYSGRTTDLLNQLTGGGFFIDNGKGNCLNDRECIASVIPEINSSTGLLGTPLLEQQYITFDMLFEPYLKVAQLIHLQSETDILFNGTHKVVSLMHRGMISEAVCGTAVTTVGLLQGQFDPITVAS